MTDLDRTAGGSAKVPLVSEVLDRLLALEGGVRARRSALFQAALQVCTDELRRVKKGATPAALNTLVERARTVLTSPTAQMRTTPSQPSITADLAPLLDDTAGSVKVLATAAAPEPPAAPPAVQPTPAATPPVAHRDPFAVAAEEAPPVPAAAEPWPPPPPPVSFVELFPPPAKEPAQEDGENAPKSRLGARVLLVAGALIVVGGAAAWYFHFRPLRAMRTAPTPAPATAAVAQPTANALPATAPALAIQPGGNTPGAEPGAANAVAPTSAPVPTAWDLTSAPTAPPTSAPVVEPIASAPAPTRPPQHAPASNQDRAAPMVSADWAGRPPIYVVHFSSYHDRGKATSDAARIAAEFRRPAYVAKVSLGAEGEWYRVVVGDFATADEAFAYHAELLARHVPDVAQVYHLTAPR